MGRKKKHVLIKVREAIEPILIKYNLEPLNFEVESIEEYEGMCLRDNKSRWGSVQFYKVEVFCKRFYDWIIPKIRKALNNRGLRYGNCAISVMDNKMWITFFVYKPLNDSDKK